MAHDEYNEYCVSAPADDSSTLHPTGPSQCIQRAELLSGMLVVDQQHVDRKWLVSAPAQEQLLAEYLSKQL